MSATSDLRRELRRLTLAAGLPLLLFIAAMVAVGAAHERDEVENELRNAARGAAHAIRQQLDVWLATMLALSSSESLLRGDLEEFYREARDMARRHGGSLLLLDIDGRPVLDILQPVRDAQPYAYRHLVARVLREQRTVVSGVMRALGTPVVSLLVPVMGEHEYAPRNILAFQVDAQRVADLLRAQQMPHNWMGVVTDSHGAVVARARAQAAFPEISAPSWYVEAARAASRGTVEGTGMTGQSMLVAFENLSDTGWTIGIAVPPAELRALWQVPLFAVGAAGLAFAVLAGLLSSFYARRLRVEIASLLPADAEERSRKGGRRRAIKEIEDVRSLLERESRLAALQTAEREKRIAAEEASRAKDDFLATVSHELRTPLGTILGWVGLLRSREQGAAVLDHGLAVIERNARQQAEIVEDLLDMSRIIAGKLAIEAVPVDFSAAVLQATEACKVMADRKRIGLHVQADAQVRVNGDHSRLVQIVSNLVSNAVKFTPEGGRVEAALGQSGACARLVVRDNGIGIAADQLAHVFERFRQAETGSTRRNSGLGLGLAIVRHLAEAHGGQVTVASDGAGKGARFTVELPALAWKTDLQAAAVAPTRQRLDGAHVLLVDDHADTREWLSRLLVHHGAKTTEAGSAVQALECLERVLPDVFISDIAMPGADGHELVGRMKAMAAARSARVPAIALSASAGKDDRDRALRAGFDAYIAKGGDPGEIVGAAARLAAEALSRARRTASSSP